MSLEFLPTSLITAAREANPMARMLELSDVFMAMAFPKLALTER